MTNLAELLTLQVNQLDFRLVLSIYVITSSFLIWRFAATYLAGEKNQAKSLLMLILFSIGILVFINTNNILIIATSWLASCLAYALLIKQSSSAEDKFANTSIYKSLIFNNTLIAIGALGLYLTTKQTDINLIAATLNPSNYYIQLSLLAVVICCIAMSAVIPFQKWILNSLHLPTPISAIMHAGFINGGGILILKIWPIINPQQYMLDLLFVCGVVTAVVANYWKLIQTDYKRMLVCSTIAQMGFMLIQCSLGLLVNALIHICGHGFFKAYLFLTTDEAVTAKNKPTTYDWNWHNLLVGTIAGVLCVNLFASVNNQQILQTNAWILLYLIIFTTVIQLFIEQKNLGAKANLMLGSYSVVYTLLYAYITLISDTYLNIDHYVKELSLLHWSGITLLLSSWVYVIILKSKKQHNNLDLNFYVKGLNATQADVKALKFN